jgi:uncharacterized protein (TIGR03066 family)
MRALSALVLGLAVAVAAGAQDKKDDPIDAKKLLGKWEATKGTQPLPPGSVIEFAKEGKLKISFKVGDEEQSVEGTYKLDKDKLKTEVKIGDETHEDTDTVKKLTDEELELENAEGKTLFLKRKK